MFVLEEIKFVAELITSIVTAFIVIIHLLKKCYPLKQFLKTTVPLFFRRHTDINGKTVRFFKGLKLERDRNIAIIKAISKNSEIEDVLVLDKNALFDIISKSEAFNTIRLRKDRT